MATVATQVAPVTGVAASYSAASAGGDKVSPGCILHVKNANAASTNVTIATPGTLQGDLAIADRVVTVANGAEKFIAITSDYADPSDGLAAITWSVTASVTFAAIRGAS